MNTEDRLNILQKIAEYSHTFDSKDAEGWAKLFMDDGVWEMLNQDKDTPDTHLDGRDAIRAWAVNNHASRPNGMRSYHHQTNTSFDELTSENARTRTMVVITVHDMSEADRPTGARVLLTGVYHDDWVKVSDGWYLKKRVLVV
jgi:ketosteroid isomerase-like protein